MRKLMIMAGTVVLVACEGPTAPAARSLRVDVKPKEAVVVNESHQFVSAAISDCNGNLVPGMFDVHNLVTVTYDGAAGYHVSVHSTIRGHLTDPATGTEYVVMQSQQTQYNVAAGFEQTNVLHFNMVARGPAPDEVYQADQHVTITPDGNVSVVTDHFTLQCS